MSTKPVVSRPLSKVQIEATTKRLRNKFDARFSELDALEREQIDAARNVALDKLLSPIDNAKVRAAIIKAIGSDDVPGVPKAAIWHQQGRPSIAYRDALADLEYTLVMADNNTFQHAIDAFEQKVAKLLKA